MTVASEDDRRKHFFRMYVAAERALHRFLKLLVHDSTLLEEVTQSVALRLWERFDSYDNSRPFEAWARGVAINVLSELRRSDRRFPRLLGEEAIAGLAEAYDRAPAVAGELSDQVQALRACLDRLPEESRQLVVRRYCDAHSVQDVARDSGKSVAATYKSLGRILERLADCVQRRLEMLAAGREVGHV
ncbi:MAG TPA: sigma-70 family RNA polymerase sigma factor [Caulifigura sp.]|jgi:RNA polymerase sigma-70 factor (ECF subfamily)|nr:sigma-70 family RNA polymerase sigma factor [Caulifigura sp.]